MKHLTLFGFFSLFFLLLSSPAFANESAKHTTLIINQVRGTECCSGGSLRSLSEQLQKIESLKINASFAIRYDALKNPEFQKVLKKYASENIQMGAFLEITPSLAQAAGVKYVGPIEHWYEAKNAYTIGYTPQDRQKIIDTYVSEFVKVFDEKPTFSVGWIVDTPTLSYLKTKHGITVHELTREQWGTDSYTLYGGPPHLPYWPSSGWALIPSAQKNENLPLIVRQTTTDPVWNYGDTTNSYTTQPNDYALRQRGFPYFEHVFLQAHSQPNSSQTFSLLGLENSMPDIDQKEFFKQLEFVSHWQKNGVDRHIETPRQFVQNYTPPSIAIYEGSDKDNKNEKAWWISTPTYRARIRQSGSEVFLSDLRVYNENIPDPYASTSSGQIAYWNVPFILDGSRYFENDTTQEFSTLSPDSLTNREETPLMPGRMILSQESGEAQLKQNGEEYILEISGSKLAIFSAEKFWLTEKLTHKNTNIWLDVVIDDFAWKDSKGETLWGFEKQKSENGFWLTPFYQATPEQMEHERETRYPLLKPELKDRTVSSQKSFILKSNQFAQAGRNPARLVLFPRDDFGFPTSSQEQPLITTTPQIDYFTSERPSGSNGMIFLDFTHNTPQKVEATITFGPYTETVPLYFAPNCKKDILWCLTHPQQFSWFVQNWVGDFKRAREEQKNMRR